MDAVSRVQISPLLDMETVDDLNVRRDLPLLAVNIAGSTPVAVSWLYFIFLIKPASIISCIFCLSALSSVIM